MKGAPEVKGERSRMTPAGTRLILAISLAGCAGFLLAFPRPALPSPPVLTFEPAAVAAVQASDRADAARAPTSEAAERVWELYRQASRAEVETEPTQVFQARQRATTHAVAALEAAEPGALARLRAKALLELEAALNGELEGDEAEVLGSFPATTERYGVFAEGDPVAPRFVIRTLFLGRWNAIMQRELTEGMSPVELRAYWGWLAVEAPGAPAELRARAREALAEVAPDLARRAQAYDAFDQGRPAEAAALYERGDTLRDRNFALGAGTLVP